MPTSLASVVAGLALLILIASLVAPSATATQNSVVTAEAVKVAGLLRLAHREAVNSGLHHGVRYEPSTRTFEAYVADISVEPVAISAPLYHPHSKRAAQHTLAQGITLTPSSQPFDFAAGGTSNDLIFDGWGTPIIVSGGATFGFSGSSLTLSRGGVSQEVQLTADIGRVRVP